MKLQGHTNKLETNVECVSKNFGIGNASKIIGILRDKLYEHKIRSLVQEYISNARDSQRQAGKDNDFEITVPTRLNPVFKVRDFGVGISPKDVEGIFIMYGSSTKEHTNELTGGLGIGSKSAWSYTDSFTIVSILDGIKRTYVAHTGCDNNGRLDLISTDNTDELTGVEIQVAVKPHDIEEFRQAVFRAIYFWEQKPTLKGELMPPTLVRGHVISDTVEVIDNKLLPEYVCNNYYGDKALAIIDGIPYTVTEKLYSKIKSLIGLKELVHKQLILYFGNGVVEVAASRESIADSKFTLDNLEKIAHKALLEVKTHIEVKFANVKSTKEYLQTYAEMSNYFNVDKYAKYGDYSIEYNAIISKLFNKVNLTKVSSLSRHGHKCKKINKNELREGYSLEIKFLPHLFFRTTQESKVKENKRIREFMKANTTLVVVEPKYEITYKEVTDDKGNKSKVEESRKLDMKSFNQVIDDLDAKDFQTLTYTEEAKVVKAKVKREDEEVCLHVLSRDRHKYITLAGNTQEWFYVPLEGNKLPLTYALESLKELNGYLKEEDGIQICMVADRALKMIEGNSNFKPLKDYLDNYKPLKKDIDSVKFFMARNNDGFVRTLSELKNIEDPLIVDMITEYKRLKIKPDHLPSMLSSKIKPLQEIKDFEAMEEKFAKAMENDYPLVNELYGTIHKKEVEFYINSKYNSKKGKK